MKLVVVSAAYAIWLVLIIVIFWAVYSKDNTALEIAVLLGMVPAVLQMLLLGFDSMGLTRPARLMGIFLLIVLLSDLFNNVDWTAVTYVIELIYISSLTLLVAGSPDKRLLRQIAAIYAVLAGLFLVYIDVTGEYTWGRLEAHQVESNFWGLMGLSVAICAFGNKSRLLTILCLAAGCATIYVASSRGSMIGFAGAMVLVGIIYAVSLRSQRLLWVVGSLATALALIVLFSNTLAEFLPVAADNLFKLNDPYRGVGQGFTGRDGLWRAAFDLWWQNPLFGVGFRQHEAYLPLGFSAHNAYLAMLADTGLFGLAWYVTLMVGSLLAALRVPDARTRNVAVGIIVSYALIGLFERRAINGANPMSLLLLMYVFFVMKEQAVAKMYRRVAAAGAAGRPQVAGRGFAGIRAGGEALP